MENKMEATIVHWGYIGCSKTGIMENRMASLSGSKDPNNRVPLKGVYRGI